MDLAEASVAYEGAGALELRCRALLGAQLEDRLVQGHGLCKATSLGNGESGGLLHIDILLGKGRLNSRLCMPMVRRRDHDSINALVCDELAVVLIDLLALGELLGQICAIDVAICHSDITGTFALQ